MMNDALPAAVGLLILLAAFFLWFVWWRSRSRGLSEAQKRQIRHHWSAALSTADPQRRVLEAEKILDQALKILGFSGSMADKLRVAGPRFSDVQKVWDAHKLRNKIAH